MTASPIPSGMQDDADLMLPDASAQPSDSSDKGSGGSDQIEEDEEQVSHDMQCVCVSRALWKALYVATVSQYTEISCVPCMTVDCVLCWGV